MKKLIFLLMIFLTCYLAGVYRNMPLMMLAVVEALFSVASFFLCLHFRKNLFLEALQHYSCVEKGAVLTCDIRVWNRSRMPISRFQARLRCGYGQARKRVKRVYGGCGSGETILQLDLVGGYCGMMHLRVERLYVYDYLSLFSLRGEALEGAGCCEMEVAVLPRERVLRIEPAMSCGWENGAEKSRPAGWRPEAHDEIRQLKEYRAEDSTRHIHWNQSARTEQLWVKEFEKEAEASVVLFLDISGIEMSSIEDKDRFYELTWAMVAGFLEFDATVHVCWEDARYGGSIDMEVADLAQCRDMMLALYQAEEAEALGESERASMQGNDWLREHRGCYRLDLDLCWSKDGEVLFQFSRKALEEQISQGVFRV